MPVNDPTVSTSTKLSRCNGEGTDPRENRNFYCLVVYPDGKALLQAGCQSSSIRAPIRTRSQRSECGTLNALPEVYDRGQGPANPKVLSLT